MQQPIEHESLRPTDAQTPHFNKTGGSRMTEPTANLRQLRAALREYERTLEAQAHQIRDLKHEVDRLNRQRAAHKQASRDRAMLVDELRGSREQLRGLSRRLVAMQEAERSYVADQLYNQAGQVLAALQMQLTLLERSGEAAPDQLPKIKETLGVAIHELHDLAAELRPVALDRAPFGRVLRSYVGEWGSRHGIAVRFLPGNGDALRLPADAAIAVFRAVQEGLANVARHAHASEVVLSVNHEGERVCVTLADDGVGFDPACLACDGLGLASMRERLETVGGTLAIESVRHPAGDSGTVLRMRAPV